MKARDLGWLGIVRLGLVQTALGSVVILTTSTMNRVMVVELALPAMVPGFLVAIHHVVQTLRPRLGFGSDVGGRRTPWIVGGNATLALGGVGAALAVAWMGSAPAAGIALAAFSFLLIGLGVGASGTALLVLLAKRVEERRRAAAATITWIMMIGGFIVTAWTAGHFLDPYSPARLVAVTSCVAGFAMLVTVAAIWNVEGHAPGPAPAAGEAEKPDFWTALHEVWHESLARRFAIFVFVSMLAYSMQDLILEPYAGLVFGFTPGQSTKLAGVQHSGVLLGMLTVGFCASVIGGRRLGSLSNWIIGGCLASALALGALAVGGWVGTTWPLRANVFALGFANGAFAVAAIGSMMGLAGIGAPRREGLRMGLWGGAQAIAFGSGGFLGTVASDAARWLLPAPHLSYPMVFVIEAGLFVFAAVLASRLALPGAPKAGLPVAVGKTVEVAP